MKRLFLSLQMIAFAAVLFSSCQKANEPSPNPAPGAVTGLLQSKWILVSMDVFADRGFNGPMYPGYTGNGAEYYEFRTDGTLFGFVQGSFATANYKLLVDDSTIYTYTINNGVPATKPDTAYIRKISSSQLILASRNPVKEWGRFVFKK